MNFDHVKLPLVVSSVSATRSGVGGYDIMDADGRFVSFVCYGGPGKCHSSAELFVSAVNHAAEEARELDASLEEFLSTKTVSA